jgi:hypothetical protein
MGSVGQDDAEFTMLVLADLFSELLHLGQADLTLEHV